MYCFSFKADFKHAYPCFKFCCLSSESEFCSVEKGSGYLPEKGNQNLATYCRNYHADYRLQTTKTYVIQKMLCKRM